MASITRFDSTKAPSAWPCRSSLVRCPSCGSATPILASGRAHCETCAVEVSVLVEVTVPKALRA